jgi:hypothetical protein
MSDYLQYLQVLPQFLEQWISVLMNPSQFLSKDFAPTNEQFIDGLGFFLKVLLAQVGIFVFLTLFVGPAAHGLKARMIANGLFGVFSLFAAAMVVHIPFWLIGGKASFQGTLLTYIYVAGVYSPLVAVALWIQVAGMPLKLRPYALNPATAQKAGQMAALDPETDKVTYFIGCLITLGLIVWIIFLVFRWLGFVHDLRGWSLAIAVLVSFAFLIPIGLIENRVASMILEPVDVHAAPQSSKSDA